MEVVEEAERDGGWDGDGEVCDGSGGGCDGVERTCSECMSAHARGSERRRVAPLLVPLLLFESSRQEEVMEAKIRSGEDAAGGCASVVAAAAAIIPSSCMLLSRLTIDEPATKRSVPPTPS